MAKQGNPKAQFILGHMYYEGLGVKIDEQETVKWYEKSAQQGYSDAQFYFRSYVL